MDEVDQVLSRLVEQIYPSAEELKKKLESNQKLRIYYGIDPTSPDLHLGHCISLQLLRFFQKLGHRAVLVFGDFTGRIGDPSGRDSQRKPTSKAVLLKNASSYKKQVAKILSFRENPPEILYNSSWWDKINSDRFLQILSHFTFSQLAERDLFQKRIRKGKPLALSEFLYPILQGYDSVALDADVEIGATDQTFNMLIGRAMMKIFKNKEKFILTTPLLEGVDGRKMSKSFGNTINITSKPEEIFGKIMSIPDELLTKYFKLATKMTEEEIEQIITKIKAGQLNPMEAKKRLAFEVVSLYHSRKEADRARSEFERIFQKKGLPTPKDFLTKEKKVKTVDLLVESGLVASKSEARRLISQGGVEVDGRKAGSVNQQLSLKDGTLIRVGKLKAVRIILRGKQ